MKKKNTLTLFATKEGEVESGPRTLLVTWKQFLKEIKGGKVCFAIIFKELKVDATNDSSDMPLEEKEMLEEYRV